MLTRTVHLRLDDATAAQLEALADTWHQSLSQVMRDALQLLLRHPEDYAALVTARLGYTHRPTPAQARNVERLLREHDAIDLARIGMPPSARGVQ